MSKLKLMLTVMAMAVIAVPAVASMKTAALDTGIITPSDLGIEYNPGLGNQDIRTTVSQIIRVALGLLGIVAVVIILIGGFTWMTAGGNDERVGQAKKWIFSGIIGLAIILSAYALSTWVINTLISATTGTVTTK